MLKIAIMLKVNSVLKVADSFLSKIALKNKKELAAVNKRSQNQDPRNKLSRATNAPRINMDYMTRVSEEIHGRLTKYIFHEFSRTESRILGALSKLDDFCLISQVCVQSGIVPELQGH